MKNLPNILTLFRILIIPILIYSFYIPGLFANLIVASLFLLASITDFFDGYFARSLKAQSNFGQCLDPIADKLLITVAIIMLIHFGNKNMIITLCGLMIICREILVSGLREFLSSIKMSLPVSRLSKYKTGFQMTALTLLLIGKQGSIYAVSEILGEEESKNVKLVIANGVNYAGEFFLVMATVLTVITGYFYLRSALKNM
jgi:CDP-diacylglycerol--glycerol-3-phosphate 3-phosphatidyltransferase